jgi:PKD repeat protein
VGIYQNYSTSPKGNYDCDSITLGFAVNANQPISAYAWNFGDGTTSTEANPRHSYNKEGIYGIVLNYTTEAWL